MKRYLRYWPVAAIVILTLIGGFLRLWRIDQTVLFLGDQGRDALIVADIFRNRDPVFIGPVTSVGNMYLGPLYYYFMLPFLWLSYPSPLGPAIAVGLLGVATIPLLYWLFRRFFGERMALLAAFLVTFNVPAIEMSRYSWNPNPEPFVATLWLYFLFRAFQGKVWSWLWVAMCCAVLMQLHYVTIIAVGISGLVWIYQAVLFWREKKLQTLVWPTVSAVAVALVFQIPLVLFDIRHNGLNLRALQEILTGDDAFGARSSKVPRLAQYLEGVQHRMEIVMTKLLLGVTQPSGALLSLVMLVSFGVMLLKEKTKKVFSGMSLVFVTLVVSIIILGAYKNDLYTHYIAFLIPPLALFYSFLLARLSRVNRYIQFVIGAFMLFYALGSVRQLHWQPVGPTLGALETVAASVHEHLEPGERYALLLLAEYKDTYGMNYRYFLSVDPEKRPVNPEDLPNVTTMVVIQEDMKLESPLTTPLYELQVFDVATPSATWDVTDTGPRIFILKKTSLENGSDAASTDGV